MMEKGVPDFSLPKTKHKGEEVDQASSFSLSQLQGQWVLIHFWATWCAPCMSELPSLLSTVKELHGKLQLVAISADSEQKDIQRFQQKFLPLQTPHTHFLWDEEKKSLQLYGVNKLPVSFLITPEHKLFRRFLGAKEWEDEILKKDLKALVQNPFKTHPHTPPKPNSSSN